jgi:steroid delta-isomerase-like uncharacterized protein
MTQSKIFISRFVEFINTANPQLAGELVATDARFYIPGQPEPLIGPDGYMAILGMMRHGFSDVQWQVEDAVTEGGTIAIRFSMSGTHDGIFMGVPATGRPIRVQAMNFYRIVDGKIVEEFGQPDMMGLMMQIGAIPLP